MEGGILLVKIITFSLPPLRGGGVSTLWCAPIPHYTSNLVPFSAPGPGDLRAFIADFLKTIDPETPQGFEPLTHTNGGTITIFLYEPQSIDGVLSLFSSRPNWDSPTPSATGECVSSSIWFRGGHTRLLKRGGES